MRKVRCRKSQSQTGYLCPVSAENFHVRPGVAEDAIARAEEITALDERFVG